MRICFLTRSDVVHPGSGGMEIQGALLAEGLVEAGHEVVVISTAHPSGLVEDTRRGVRIFYLAGAPAAVYSREWWSKSVQKFSELHREEPFDVVLSQSVSGWGYLKVKNEFAVPCVAIMHGTTFREMKTRWVGISSPFDFLRFLEESAIRLARYFFRWRYWFKRFDAIIAVSEAVRGSLIKNYFLSPRKVFVVYNGIRVKGFANLPAESSARAGRKNILYLGRLDKDKGLGPLLLATVDLKLQIPNLKLLFVGGGPEFDHLNNLSRDLGLADTVRFVGPVPYKDVARYYWQAEVFVLPSTALEGLPMTIIEALAAGLPVVASRVGGVTEVVGDGKTGILVEPGNVEELSAALLKLLTDEELRERMGRAARRIAREKFSQKIMVEKTVKVLERVRR